MIKYLSLFSGIGGFEHGIETSNKKEQFKCIGYSEIDKYAKNIYKNTIQTTLTGEMLPKSKQKIYQRLTSWLEDSHVKHFLSQEKEEGLVTQEELSFLKSQGFSKTKNPNIFYSKTLKVSYLTTKEELSRQSLGHSPNWGMMCNGRYLIAKIMEYPRIGKEYILKDFLEKEVDKKYYLSEKQQKNLMYNRKQN